MSPILVRPVREQLEHDRVIRLLQARWRRRYDVAVNPGEEKNTAVRIGNAAVYPDLVLNDADRGRKLQGVIEVETGESVNHLEAMAQWVHLGKARAPFYLYVPAGALEVTRRLCTDNQVAVTEIWIYHVIGDQIRFTLMQRAPAQKPEKAELGVRRPPSKASQPRAAATRKTSPPSRSRKAVRTSSQRTASRSSTKARRDKRR